MHLLRTRMKRMSVICGGILGLFLIAAGPAHAQSVPIGHWTFDEATFGTGTGTVLDSASGAHHGTIKGGLSNGAAVYVPGVVGAGALSFNGDDRVDFGLVPALDLTGGSYTVAFWLKYDETQLGRIINMDDAGNCSGGYSIFLSSAMRTTHNNGNCNDTSSFFAQPAFGEFVHIAVVYNSSAQTITTYYDGVSQGIFSKSPSITNLTTDGNDPLLFGTYNSSNNQGLKGTLDDVRLYDVALSAAEIDQFITPSNLLPTAKAGVNQSIRAGDTVTLNGGASFDDNTASTSLLYSWTFSNFAGAVEPILTGADTATPSFVANAAGTYVIELVVTDEGTLDSLADEVEVSTDNLAPTANAGSDQLIVIGTNAALNGSGSSDPESDALTYNWTILSAPAGNAATVSNPNDVTAGLTPTLEGAYEVVLSVSDFLGEGTPDTVEITATSAANFAEIQLLDAHQIVAALTQSQVTKRGNKRALTKKLRKAVKALQKGKTDKAIKKLNKALERVDGCTLRGEPDAKRKQSGFKRDWITDCSAQTAVYTLINTAITTISTP